MARQRSPDRDKAYEIWSESNGQVPLKDIATQLGISEGTVRGWKAKDKWEQQINGTLQKEKRNAPKKTKKLKERSPKTTERSKEVVAERIVKSEPNPNLTDKQVLFVAEYLTDYNATRAAIAVGYSKKNASQIGWQLLQKTKVQEEISRQTKIVTNSLGITSQRVLLEYLKLAFSDITAFVEFGREEVPVMGMFGPVKDDQGKILTEEVNIIKIKDCSQVDGALIKEVKQGKDGISIKLYDKLKALEKIEKYMDLLPDHHKRRMEEEKLKLDQERLKLDQAKVMDPDDDIEDDGFIQALQGKVSEVWTNGDSEED